MNLRINHSINHSFIQSINQSINQSLNQSIIMKTGLGLYHKYRMLHAYINLVRFGLKKNLLGFDVANLFLQRVDKYSLLLIIRKYGAKIGESCKIETGLIFHNCKDYSNHIIFVDNKIKEII